MTREEAYSRIDAIIAKYEIDEEYVTITSTLDYDALRIARKALEQEPCKNAIGREDMLDAIGHGTTYTSEELQRIIKGLPPVNPQKCDRCEVGNPCLYCRHEFEPQERSDKE